MEADVVLCGYGPTGAVAANLLGRAGVRALVVERHEDVWDVPRAVHFDGEIMRIFQAMGLEKEVRAVSACATRLGFVNGRGLTLLSADVSEQPELHGWPVGNFFNQPLLEAHLRRGAARYPSVEVRLGWELVSFDQDDRGVTVRVRGAADGREEEVRARYLLGCDGASSPTREQAGIELEDLECDEPWLVCDLIVPEDVGPLHRTALQICDPRRPTTLVPCEGRHIRWEFMLRPGDDPATLEREETARAMMAPHLHRVAPGLRPGDGELIRSKVYSFHGLLAKRWRAGRVFLLGDAAHQMPPFLGQGLCSGVRDAYNLSWKLAGVLEGRFAASLLDTYGSERGPHAARIVRQAVRTGAIIQTTNRWRALQRDAYFLLARLWPRLQAPFRWAPGWSLGPGLFDTPPGEGTAQGQPIDQPTLATSRGERVRLDEALGEGFALVGLGVDPGSLVDAAAGRVLAGLGARIVHVGPEGPFQDADGGLAAWAERVGGGRVALVRPDRQVFGLYGAAAEASLAATVSAAVGRLGDALGAR